MEVAQLASMFLWGTKGDGHEGDRLLLNVVLTLARY